MGASISKPLLDERLSPVNPSSQGFKGVQYVYVGAVLRSSALRLIFCYLCKISLLCCCIRLDILVGLDNMLVFTSPVSDSW